MLSSRALKSGIVSTFYSIVNSEEDFKEATGQVALNAKNALLNTHFRSKKFSLHQNPPREF